MRRLILATATALALAATAPAARAQYVIYNGNVPSPPGAYAINTPFYNGLAFNNGVITAFPTPPRYGYGYGYPPYPLRPPFAVGGNPGYNPYPGIWRP